MTSSLLNLAAPAAASKADSSRHGGNGNNASSRVNDDDAFARLVERQERSERPAEPYKPAAANEPVKAEAPKPQNDEKTAQPEKPAEKPQADKGAKDQNKNETNNQNTTDQNKATQQGQASGSNEQASQEASDTDGLPGANPPSLPVPAVDPTALAEGGLFPDVTAIMPETVPSVQPADDQQQIVSAQNATTVMLSQPLGLLALASQMEKTMAALNAQQQNPQTPSKNPLAQITNPMVAMPLLMDVDAQADLMPVTPLVDVTQVEEPAGDLAKPVTVPQALLNAENPLKKNETPAPSLLQVNVTDAEEVADAEALLQKVAQPQNDPGKVLVTEKAPQAKASTENLLADLQQIMSGRLNRDPSAVMNMVGVAAGITASNVSGIDLTQGDGDAFAQNPNSSLHNPLAALSMETMKGTQQSGDASFARMLSHTSNHTPVADQVMVQIKTAVDQGKNMIRIQLDPAELGRVEVRMEVSSEGRMQMNVTADNRDTLAMLQREARALERALQDLGLKADAGSLSFHLRDQNQQNQKFTKSDGFTVVDGVEAIAEEPRYTDTSSLYSLQVQDGLDIRV